MTAQLVYKGLPHDACLQFYGAYCPDNIKQAIINAGWHSPEPKLEPPKPSK